MQTTLARRLGWNPSRTSVYQALAKDGLPQLPALQAALKQAVSRPHLPDYAAFSEHTYQTVNRVLLELITPQQGAAEMAKR